MDALIYLRLQHGPVIEQDDLDRLDILRLYARDNGHTISQVWPVHAPEDSIEPPNEWWNARQDLTEGRFKVIILWHEDRGEPDTMTREDLGIPEPAVHPLSTPCNNPDCGHTLNWHHSKEGCNLPRCTCKQFTARYTA